MLGRKHSEETKAKMKVAAIKRGDCGGAAKLRGSKRPKDVVAMMRKTMFKKGQVPFNKGIHHTAIMGDKHWLWKGGISKTEARKHVMMTLEYKLWRKAVFERDGYTCQWCGMNGIYIEADHIKAWSLYPALRYAIDNGRTLCKPCHKKTDTYGAKALKKKI